MHKKRKALFNGHLPPAKQKSYTYTRKENYDDYMGICFCARAMDKPSSYDRRLHMLYLCVRGNLMAGTNGSRLHEYKLRRKIPDGLYQIIVKTSGKIVIAFVLRSDWREGHLPPYPDWLSIFPKKEETDSWHMVSAMTKESFDTFVHRIFNLFERPVNIGYLRDLGYDMSAYIPKEDDEPAVKRGMLYFTNYEADRRAIIMSMR